MWTRSLGRWGWSLYFPSYARVHMKIKTCSFSSRAEQESVESNPVKLGGVSFNLEPRSHSSRGSSGYEIRGRLKRALLNACKKYWKILLRLIFSLLKNMFIKIQYLMSFLCVIVITGWKEVITFSSCISLLFRLCRHLSHNESQI